jgi:thermospermine synthase
MSTAHLWMEEELESDLKLSYQVKSILHTGKSDFQEVGLIDTGPFGKVLLLDGKLQSSESDEFVYHECLVHPAMLAHPDPKTVFIAGGGEGSTAREVLRHKSVTKCVMVDIDEVVVKFCKQHLTENTEAFADPRLELIIGDARAGLENYPGKFDVYIGDLADPVWGNPCYQLYTKAYYEMVKSKLNPGGIMITQSGPAGVSSCTQVWTPINNTLRQVFPVVMPLAAHVPSFADTWGWQLAGGLGMQAPKGKGKGDGNAPGQGKGASDISEAEIDARIAARVTGELRFLDGRAYLGIASLNKTLRKALQEETRVFTMETPVFIHGSGLNDKEGVDRGGL